MTANDKWRAHHLCDKLAELVRYADIFVDAVDEYEPGDEPRVLAWADFLQALSEARAYVSATNRSGDG